MAGRDSSKRKLSSNRKGENEETGEAQSRVVIVPIIVEPVPVELHLAIVLDEVRDVQVTVVVLHKMYTMPSMPLPLDSSWDCIVFSISNARAYYTKYLQFFMKFYIHHSLFNRNQKDPQRMDTGFGRKKPWSLAGFAYYQGKV